jgi:mannose-6-phosphate isomerase-like protein (cupin superfamily)
MRAMVRRVITGHDEAGRSRVATDDEAYAFELGDSGAQFNVVWGRATAAHFPDDGAQPPWPSGWPGPGGCTCTVMELPPGHSTALDAFVADQLHEFADPERPGMHATPSTDFDVVLEGTVGMELDDGEVILGPGDIVVQNGTMHRWHNRGAATARILSVVVGATHDAFPPASD